ncbi:hypothetical protein BB560_005407 [Smittium megazygosporum]|uniref:Uncharacterized protein n=1 Tax=Smittium megazygosporum TaxID=133381 RepID=A0A2T9Z626_9FUNG|nr:hypothetical protein BB560_005407 [Smittium megazygosporum]
MSESTFKPHIPQYNETNNKPVAQVSHPPQNHAKLSDNRIVNFVNAALASCFAASITNSVELVKTRMQLQGELVKTAPNTPKVYKNFPQAISLIVQKEGFSALFKGLSSAFIYQTALNGIRIGSIAGSPFYLVKTRMQSHSSFASVGHQHNYTGTWQALTHIYSTRGIRGLFQGISGSCLRVAIGSPAQLVSYDYFKSVFGMKFASPGSPPDNSFKTHFCSSMAASLFVVVFMNPFDVVNTRLYNQKRDHITNKGVLYNGLFDCIAKTARTEGIAGFYKGITVHYLRMGPHTILTFVAYEHLKSLVDKHF